MSRMLKTSVFAAVLGAASAQQGSAVNVDMDMLTDFTARFSVDTATLIKNAQLPPDVAMGMPGFAFHGAIQADVGGERLKITLHGFDSMPDHPMNPNEPAWMIGAHEKGSAEFIFDGPGGFVSYRGKADERMPHVFGGDGGDSTPPIKLEACAKVNFPKGLLPPGQMIKSQMVQMKPMIEQQLSMPHTDATVDGDQIAIYYSDLHQPPIYVGIKEKDGTPLGAGVVQPTDGTWKPFFRFTQWTHGAGEISEIQCAKSLDSTSLAADRHAAVHMQAFDRVMASLKGAEALQRVFAAFPAEPSLIFKSAGNAATALDEQPASSSSSLFPTIAVAVAAGALGGMVSFFAFVKGTSKANRVSLISDDA